MENNLGERGVRPAIEAGLRARFDTLDFEHNQEEQIAWVRAFEKEYIPALKQAGLLPPGAATFEAPLGPEYVALLRHLVRNIIA
jgi:hypothetical protein